MQARAKRAFSQVTAGVECEICRERFKTNWTLRRHHLAKHVDQRPTIVCPEDACNESFTRWDSLERHFKSQHAGIKVPCPVCHKLFRKDYLHEHARVTNHYPTGEHASVPDRAQPPVVIKSSTSGLRIDTQHLDSAPVDAEMGLQNSATTCDSFSNPIKTWDASSSASDNCATSLLTSDTSPASSSGQIARDNPDDSSSISRLQSPDAISDSPDLGSTSGETCSMAVDLEVFSPELESNSLTKACNMSDQVLDEPSSAQSTSANAPQSEVGVVENRLLSTKLQFRHRLRSTNNCDDSPPCTGGTCTLCDERFGTHFQDVAKHLKGHLVTTPSPRHACSVCGIGFVFLADLHRHRRVRSHYINQDLMKTSLLDCDLVRPSTHQSTDSWLIDKFRDDYIAELRAWEQSQICIYVDSFEMHSATPPYEVQQISRQNFRSFNAIGLRKREQILGSCSAALRTGGAQNDRILLGELVDRFTALALVPEADYLETEVCTASTSPLILALQDGMKGAVERIVRLRNSHLCDYCEQYALCWASGRGDRESVQLLLDWSLYPRGLLEPRELGLPGLGPLEYAMQQAKHAVVDLLLDRGARITKTADVHEIYLTKLMTCDSVSRMQSILAVLPKDNLSLITRKLVVCTAQGGSEEMLHALLDAGADADARDDVGVPALHFASALGRNGIVKLLLAHGADSRATSRSCETALHYACSNGHFSTAAILDAHENRPGDATWLCSWTTNTLIQANRSGNVQTVTSLLYFGSSVHERDEDRRTALHHVLEYNTDRHTRILEHLIIAGASVEVQDRWNQTPLIIAARSGAYAAARRLLAAGARPDAKDIYGSTALDRAKSSKHELLIHLLQTASQREEEYLIDYMPPA